MRGEHTGGGGVGAPGEGVAMYPHEGDPLLANTSRVDIDRGVEALAAEHPLFAKAEYYEALLGPGEALYMPPRWCAGDCRC